MRVIILPFVALWSCINSSMLGQDPCMDGPSFWCNNIGHASECAAVEHCVKTYWSEPVINDQLCKLCKNVAASVIVQVKNNEPQIEAILEKTCDYCKTPDDCRETIEGYWPQIKQLIDDDLSPDMLCSAMNMCQQESEGTGKPFQLELLSGFTGPLMERPIISEEQQEVLKDIPVDDTDSHIRFFPENKPAKVASTGSCTKNCQDCMNFGASMKTMATDSAKLEKFVSTLRKMCDQLPMTGLCHLVLNKKVIAEVIGAVDVSQLCQDTAMCDETDQPQPSPECNDCGCKNCKALIKDVKHISATDLEQFEFMIRHTCDLVPHPVNDMCKTMAKKLADQAAENLQDLDPTFGCGEISLCGKNFEEPTSPVVTLENNLCDYCETAVQYIQLAIDNDMSADEIKMALEQLCLKIPPQMNQQCTEFIDEYYQILIDDVSKALDHPDIVCKKLHMCKRNAGDEKIIAPVPDECTFGPAYWCKNAENIKKCHAEDYCKKAKEEMPLLGANECTFGPSYWCENKKQAEDCDAMEYCQRVMNKNFEDSKDD